MTLPRCNAVFTSLICAALFFTFLPRSTGFVPESGSIREDAILRTLPQIEVVQGSFKPNATLVATLVDFDIPSELAQSVARLVQPVFDVRGFRSGNAFTLEKDTDGNLRAFEYKISDDKILEVQRGTEAYEAKVSSLEMESRETTITSEITPAQNSLYAALAKEDRQAVQLAEKVASIFAWDVDFNTGL
ncbi:MAG TPA: hypothetical protein VMB70_09470, partial [Terriglobia bacterium]|nr:hypothetical protein [Terriglobia bacterium]